MDTLSETGEKVSFKKRRKKRLLGQAVKTPPFHGGNTGSIPVGVIYFNQINAVIMV